MGFMNVQTDFHAAGDGHTDDRQAIKDAFAAAVSLEGPAAVFFPPGEYMVSQDQALSQPYCLDLPGSNIQIWGVKGRSWIKAMAGLPSPVAVLRIDGKTNVTIRDLGVDGNWGNARTEIAPASMGIELPSGTIHVTDTSAFPHPQGSMVVIASDGSAQPVSYTGVTATSFTGCTGGTGSGC